MASPIPPPVPVPGSLGAPRLRERIRAALDPTTMALSDHVDADALERTLGAMQRPDWPHDLAFGNLPALELGLALIDAGHHATESAAMPVFAQRIAAAAGQRGLHAPVGLSTITTTPWEQA